METKSRQNSTMSPCESFGFQFFLRLLFLTKNREQFFQNLQIIQKSFITFFPATSKLTIFWLRLDLSSPNFSGFLSNLKNISFKK